MVDKRRNLGKMRCRVTERGMKTRTTGNMLRVDRGWERYARKDQ